MADEAGNREAFRIQRFYCGEMGAPIYARLCEALAAGMTRASRTGVRVLDWPGEPTRDALPLRLIGGLHALVRAGVDKELAAIFAGQASEPALLARQVDAVLVRHDEALLPWLDGPPQTNEPGRSAALMRGLIEVARRHGPRLELLEIGSSAGLNLLIDRYRFDLGGVALGPADAPVAIVPEWRGSPPPRVAVEITSVKGCDIQPLDASDPAVAARLLAYVWAEMPARSARLERAIAMVRKRGIDLVRADAAAWLEEQLARPQEEGVTRVLMHSVVWQYLPEASTARVRQAMAAAGARADPARPLGWVMMEPDRALAQQVVEVRSWAGEDSGWQTVATAHAHGSWVGEGAGGGQGPRIDLPDGAAVRAG